MPCVVADDLTDEQIKAFRIADNSAGQIAQWDLSLLEKELADIDYDMMQFGLQEQLEQIEEQLEQSKTVEEDDFNIEKELGNIENIVTKYGDIWQLGKHRLMCGDSTKLNDIEKLKNGIVVDMVFTDPPYNIDYKGVKDDRKIKNDKMKDDVFVRFLEKSIPICDTAYVCCSWQFSHLFKNAMNNLGMQPKAMIVWDKVNPAQHLDKYFKQHEIIWYYGKFGGEKTIRGDVWQLKRQRNDLHPTMKPIELIAMALEDNPDKKVVYDGFGGSGSTLIACEQLNRTCYMMEIEPKYCDVIIKRWENFTGKKAQKII